MLYGLSVSKKMKPFSIVVTGEPTYIKSLINCISYGPDDLITHRYQVNGSDAIREVRLNFGSLQVDEDHRIDFFGGNDEALFEFIDNRPSNGFKGMIVTLDADNSVSRENFKDVLVKQMAYLRKYALVIGVSGADYASIKQAEESVRQSLTELNVVAPVFSIEPDNKEDVSLLVESLLCLARPGISDSKTGKSSFKLSEELN